MHVCWKFSSFALALALFAPANALATRACLSVNGGVDKTQNRCDFVRDATAFYKALDGCDTKTYLNADGKNNEPDMPECNPKTLAPVRDKSGEIVYKNTDLPEIDGPGTVAEVRKRIQELAKAAMAQGGNHQLVLYFNDHGANASADGSKKHSVCLWGMDLSVDAFRAITSNLPPELKIISIHDHCYSGGMLPALIFDKDGHPRHNSCGFSVAADDEVALPGYTPAFLDSLAKAKKNGKSITFEEAHHEAAKKYTASTPQSSSDVFLLDYYNKSLRDAQGRSTASAVANTSLHCISGTQALGDFAAITAAQKAIIRERLEELRAQTEAALKSMKINPKSSAEKVLAGLDEYDHKRKELTDAAAKATEDLTRAKNSFLRSKFPAETAKHLELVQKFKDVPDDGSEANMKKREALKKEAHDSLKALVIMMTDAVGDTKEKAKAAYEKYVADHANDAAACPGTPLPCWPADAKAVSTAADAALEAHTSITKKTPEATKRLRNLVAKSAALQHMLRNGKKAEIETYMDLVSCESTSIN